MYRDAAHGVLCTNGRWSCCNVMRRIDNTVSRVQNIRFFLIYNSSVSETQTKWGAKFNVFNRHGILQFSRHFETMQLFNHLRMKSNNQTEIETFTPAHTKCCAELSARQKVAHNSNCHRINIYFCVK